MRALLSTRKGLLLLDKKGASWKLGRAHFDGVRVSYADFDPVHRVIRAGLVHGHWGPKLHVSKDKGKTFAETAVPKFPEHTGESLKEFWVFATDRSGRIYAGVEPAGLFWSDDQGATWTFCEGLARVRGKDKWMAGGTDGSCVHSIVIDPRDEKRLLLGISVAGVLESRDRGLSWEYRSRGMKAEFLPDPDTEIGQDPHCVTMAPSNPDVLWQQNHCGIFKSEDMGMNWTNLSKARGMKSAFGWGIVVDEKDAKVAYTVPALSDETRVPWRKRLIVQKTTDGGKSWKVLDQGLPKAPCYDIVYRNALALKGRDLLMGSTTGHVFFSGNAGKTWKQAGGLYPPIYAARLMA